METVLHATPTLETQVVPPVLDGEQQKGLPEEQVFFCQVSLGSEERYQKAKTYALVVDDWWWLRLWWLVAWWLRSIWL